MMKRFPHRESRVPLYAECASRLRASIEEGRYAVGEFLPSERDLSEQFRVNRITLRKGLATLVQEKVLESIPGTGNRVIATLRTRQQQAPSLSIGCATLRSVHGAASSPYYADIVHAIEEIVSGAGYDLVLAQIRGDDLWGVDGSPKKSPAAVDKQWAGAITIGGVTDELAIAYTKRGIPAVAVDRYVAHRAVSCVTPDNFKASHSATRYLIELGHRRIGFLSAAADPVVHARLDGYRSAMRDAGLPLKQRDVFAVGYTISEAHERFGQYLRKADTNLPTGFVAINDEAALGVVKALQEHGYKVPQDISVIGFDDIAWAAHANPPLSTVHVPRREMGKWAARQLLDQVESKAAPSKAILEVALEIRGSCARPKPR